MGLIENYVDTVRRETGMFGVYPPNQRIRLGDFGVVQDARFIRHGNLQNLDGFIPIREVTSSVKMNREFKSRRTRKTLIGAGASGTVAGPAALRARLQLDFGAESAVYFAVAGCVHKQLDNLGALSNEIVARSRASKWNDDYRVVTALVESENTTVVLAREDSSQVVLEAEADVPVIDMADAQLRLRLTFDSAASENWVTVKPENGQQPLTPFCWFHHIDRDLLGYRPSFDPTAESAGEAASPRAFVRFDSNPLRDWSIG